MSALRTDERVPAAAMGASIDAMVRRAPLVLAASLVSAALVACAAFSGGSDGEEPGDRDAAAPDPDSSSGGEGFEPGDARGPDAPAPLCEPGDVVSVTATADVPLYPGGPQNVFCYGTMQPGASDLAALKADFFDPGGGAVLPSAAVFRFSVGPTERNLLESPNGKLHSLELVLARAAVCPDQPCTSTTFALPGALLAYPLRRDWDELNGPTDSELGADNCRRKRSDQRYSDESAWASAGAGGAKDIGDSAGRAVVDTSQDQVAIGLDPAKWTGGWLGADEADNFAVRVAPADGARFVVATKEYTSVDPPRPKPTLRITRCK